MKEVKAMLKTVRTKWFNEDYYLIKEDGNLFRLYVNNVYRLETKNFNDFNKIFLFRFEDMDIKFINEYEFVK